MDQNLDLRFYLGVLRRRFFPMLAVFVVFSGAAFAVAVLWPPTYESQAKFIVESQQIPPDLVKPTVTSYADERLQIIEQRITARDAVMGLVDKLNLYPEKRKELTPTELYNLVRKSIKIERVDLPLISRRADNRFALAFTASFDDRSPNVASAVANELVTLILNENVKSRTRRATETTRFIEDATQKRQAELARLDTKISQFKLENDAALPEKLGFQMSRLEQAKSNLASLDKEIQASEEQERLLRFELSVKESVVSPGDTTQLPQATLARQIDALKAELARKRSIYTDNHPDVLALKDQINALQAQATSFSQSTPARKNADAPAPSTLSLDARLVQQKIDAVLSRRAFLKRQRDDVEKSVESLNRIIAKVPEVQSLLGDLQRQHDIVQKQLDDLTAKLNEAKMGEKLEKDQQGERFEIIEQPIVPTDPIKPKRPLILAGGVGVAAGAALALAFLLELINRTVHTASDIIRGLGQPPIGIIPYFTTAAERRRNRIRIAFGSLTAVATVAAALAAIHFLYMPLDIVLYKVLNRFQV